MEILHLEFDFANVPWSAEKFLRVKAIFKVKNSDVRKRKCYKAKEKWSLNKTSNVLPHQLISVLPKYIYDKLRYLIISPL